jgi:hypothetical protein
MTEELIVKEPSLRLLSEEETLIIDACDGTETIAERKTTGSNDHASFEAGIDASFLEWDLNHPSIATEDILIQVYGQTKDATYENLFASFAQDLNQLCLSQHQIKQFCRAHYKWMRADGYSTFFLFKKEERYFVARVGRGSGIYFNALYVRVDRFEDDILSLATHKHRLVIPYIGPSFTPTEEERTLMRTLLDRLGRMACVSKATIEPTRLIQTLKEIMGI